MNPPFTRSVGGNLLFGSLPPTQRRKLQDELASRLKRRRASATGGLAPAFVVAAAPRLRPGEGRLALVLPVTLCTGPSWCQTRTLIEQEFVLDMVIVSHDPLRWNFSDSTSLSEVMIIATRRSEGEDSAGHRTVFINLWRNEESVLAAQRMANAIAETPPADIEGAGTALLEVDGEHVGEMVSIPEHGIAHRQWRGVQFARVELTRCALALLDEGVLRIPGEVARAPIDLCPLPVLGAIGPDRRGLVDVFERTSAVTPYPMVVDHDSDHRRFLQCLSDLYLSPLAKPKGGRKSSHAAHLWQQAGRLLIAERLWLNTARVLAMRAETRVLANVWWPVRVDDARTEKALALWMNSSLGLLTILAYRTTTRGGWVAMKKADLEELPVLDVRALDDAQVDALADLFDELAEAEFARLPDMADCHARARLDERLARILGLPDLTPLRRLLATEPVVSNQRL